MGSTAPRPAWCPWKHTPAYPQTCTEQTHESNARNAMFLDEPWRPRPLLSKFLPFATLLRNPWQGLTLTCSRPVSVAARHLSIPQRRVAGSVFGDHQPFQSPKELPIHFSLLFVQPGATQFLCDLEMSNSDSTRKKGSLPATLEVWTEKKLSVEGTDYIHFTACTMHSMFCALFSVPHLFARELLMNSPPWSQITTLRNWPDQHCSNFVMNWLNQAEMTRDDGKLILMAKTTKMANSRNGRNREQREKKREREEEEEEREREREREIRKERLNKQYMPPGVISSFNFLPGLRASAQEE